MFHIQVEANVRLYKNIVTVLVIRGLLSIDIKVIQRFVQVLNYVPLCICVEHPEVLASEQVEVLAS